MRIFSDDCLFISIYEFSTHISLLSLYISANTLYKTLRFCIIYVCWTFVYAMVQYEHNGCKVNRAINCLCDVKLNEWVLCSSFECSSPTCFYKCSRTGSRSTQTCFRIKTLYLFARLFVWPCFPRAKTIYKYNTLNSQCTLSTRDNDADRFIVL